MNSKLSTKNAVTVDKKRRKLIMKILMGTKNPGKIEGARQAFEKYF